MLQFPSGVKVIGDSLWIVTTKFQKFIAGTAKPDEVKYRILAGSVSNLIRGSGCDKRSGVHLLNKSQPVKLNYNSQRSVSRGSPLFSTLSKIYEDEIFPSYFRLNLENQPVNYVLGNENWRRIFGIP